MNNLMNKLELVYPPISNQEGEWFYEDKEVREYVSRSKLYMITHRHELKFKEAKYLQKGFGVFRFEITQNNKTYGPFEVSAKRMLDALEKEDSSLRVEMGDKLIKVTDESTDEILIWYTVDKFIYDVFRGHAELELGDLTDLINLWNFDLLYVGISKENDSLTRLYSDGHKNRTKILTNEYQKSKESRLTDEVVILLFDIDSISIKQYKPFMDVEDFFSNPLDGNIKVVADAEKAFVSLLETKYNSQGYPNYPISKDGLYDEKLTGISFEINENITLNTENSTFNGRRGGELPKDYIKVQGDKKRIVKANF